jgi:hypothetical protein
MYIRFVIAGIDEHSRVRKGIVQAAIELRDDSRASEQDRQELSETLRWLNEHLPRPARFNRSKSKGYYRRRTAGISWLKPTAHEHLARVRRLSEIVELYGHSMSRLEERRPGYIVYEDEFQVVAEPFTDTLT